MCYFGMTLNVNIAYQVGLFQSEGHVGIAFRVDSLFKLAIPAFILIFTN
jgi:hypothetical protein